PGGGIGHFDDRPGPLQRHRAARRGPGWVVPDPAVIHRPRRLAVGRPPPRALAGNSLRAFRRGARPLGYVITPLIMPTGPSVMTMLQASAPRSWSSRAKRPPSSKAAMLNAVVMTAMAATEATTGS